MRHFKLSNRFTLFLGTVLVLALSACGNSEPELSADLITSTQTASKKKTVNENKLPKFQWETDSHDLGKLAQGEKRTVKFAFKNVGKSDLVISSIDASCGCTISRDYPKKPIRPGEGGEIEVEFNSEGLRGMQFKNVSVLGNTKPATSLLQIKAEVVAPEIF
ncbi:MAG: DUF1573 domain-containing protein [Luteibaculaceae bacterium]